MTEHQDVVFYQPPTCTEGFTPDVTWEPFIDHKQGRVGYRVTRHDTNEVTWVYMNPSSGTDDGEAVKPDVFIYEGEHNDPSADAPVCFIIPQWEEDRAKMRALPLNRREGQR